MEQASIDTAWKNYRHKLLQFIKSKVNSADDAEDILAAVFEKLLLQYRDHKIPENLPAWLYRVTRNCIVDHYRKHKYEPLPEVIVADTPDADELKQLSGCIKPMLNLLPDNYRQALLLSDIDGKKYMEVADSLGISLSAVKSRVTRGRDKLRKKLLNCCATLSDNASQSVGYDHDNDECCNGCENCE